MADPMTTEGHLDALIARRDELKDKLKNYPAELVELAMLTRMLKPRRQLVAGQLPQRLLDEWPADTEEINVRFAASLLGISKQHAHQLLLRLVFDGHILRRGRGIYARADKHV